MSTYHRCHSGLRARCKGLVSFHRVERFLRREGVHFGPLSLSNKWHRAHCPYTGYRASDVSTQEKKHRCPVLKTPFVWRSRRPVDMVGLLSSLHPSLVHSLRWMFSWKCSLGPWVQPVKRKGRCSGESGMLTVSKHNQSTLKMHSRACPFPLTVQ